MDLRERRSVLLARDDLRGRELAGALAAATDAWLQEVVTAACGPEPCDVALVAVGGYGRGELAPGSDLDLVLVHRNRADIDRVAEAVWYPVWDSGARLDHAVRTAREVGAAMDADRRVALGWLDARTVAGSAALGAEIRQAAADKWAARADRWLPELGAAVADRHRAHGDLAFLLEPDLKESRGGMRDLAVLAALARVAPLCGPALAPFAEVAGEELAGAAGHLLDTRVELQRLTGRAANRLGLEDQDAVAAALGEDADELMARLAAVGRAVAWAGDTAWARSGRVTDRAGRGGRPGAWIPDPIEPGLLVRDGEVTLAYGADPACDPALALRAAAAAAELDLPMAAGTVTALARSAPAPPGHWPGGLRHALLRLLGAGRPLIPAWETLDHQGVIGRLLPEWDAVRHRPQRNAYHRYTVDRHLLETVANTAAHQRRVARPDLLALGALLHDIGKGRGGDHTEAGVAVVRRLAPRLGLPPEDASRLERLVAHHLLLPDVATRRDLDDPATIRAVAGRVGDRLDLELLAALTEADSTATGPAAWGSWKAGLVAQLVERVAATLEGRPPAPPEPEAPELDEDQRRRLARGAPAVVVDLPEVTVVGAGHPTATAGPPSDAAGAGLLAAVAGALAVDGLTVLRASLRAAGPGDGGALLVAHVQPAWDAFPPPEAVRSDLEAALAGTLDVAGRLADLERREPRRRLRRAGPADVAVRVDDDTAPGAATVMEVHGPDRPGTLWRIAAAIAACGVGIDAALVATLGADVVDTFYLRGPAGATLGRAELDRVAAAVTASLQPTG